MEWVELLHAAIKQDASDLHLCAGNPVLIRREGELKPFNLANFESTLDQTALLNFLGAMLNASQWREFKQNFELDFSFEIADLSLLTANDEIVLEEYRFRVHLYHQLNGYAATIRIIPKRIPSFAQLQLPLILQEIIRKTHGLVLVVGTTGSGKSTTLAALIDYLNQNFSFHLITLEDPLEFIHHSKRCLINQREISRHTHGYANALCSVLRADPDIIVIGELRDAQTIKLALSAAETGHLVLATLHSDSALKAINRIIDVFSSDEKTFIRSILSVTLEAIIAQSLVKKRGGGRIAALELLVCNNAIRHLIREDKIPQIYSLMQTGRQYGMWTFEQHINQLCEQGIISHPSSRGTCDEGSPGYPSHSEE